MAARAVFLGQDGARRIARAVGVHPLTVAKGIAELRGPGRQTGNLRRPGGGRKKITETDPDLLPALLNLVEPGIDTQPNLQWTMLSTRALAADLQRRGHRISAWSVANLLRQNGFRLLSGSRSALRKGQLDRREQYHRVNDYVGRWLAAHQAVISLRIGPESLTPLPALPDPLPGEPALPEWTGPGEAVGQITEATTLTAEDATVTLALNAIRTWWERRPVRGEQLLVVADSIVYATGSRAWRRGMARLAAETGLAISVCYLPPITMRWVSVSELIRSTVVVQRSGQQPRRRQVDLLALAGGGHGHRRAAVPPSDGPSAWNYTVRPAA